MATKARDANYKCMLTTLTRNISVHVALIDELMKLPSTDNRGRAIATVLNKMDMANDSALHFGLGLSFEKIRKDKKKMQAMAANALQVEMRSW